MENKVIEVTSLSFDREVLNSDLPVLLEFWAPWCGPCKALAPMLDRLAQQHEGVLKIAKFNVDELSDSFAKFGLRGVPTLVAYRGGKEVLRSTGATASRLQAVVDAALVEKEAPIAPALSFNGDPQLQAKAVAILTEATKNETLPDTAAVTEWVPAQLGLSSFNALFLPSFIGVLGDGLHELCTSYRWETDVSARLLAAVPVGADLNKLAEAIASSLLLQPTLGLISNLRNQPQASPLVHKLLADIQALQVAAPLGHTSWEDIAARRLAFEAEPNNSTDQRVARALTGLDKPIRDFTALDIVTLLEVCLSHGDFVFNCPLSELQIKAEADLRALMKPLYDTSPPADFDQEQTQRWLRDRDERGQALAAQFWREHPDAEQAIRDRNEGIRELARQRFAELVSLVLDTVNCAEVPSATSSATQETMPR